MADMEAIYAWTEIDSDEGENIIYSYVPEIGVGINLQHRHRDIVERFRSIAQEHAKLSGHKVRLVKFTRSETLETL